MSYLNSEKNALARRSEGERGGPFSMGRKALSWFVKEYNVNMHNPL